MGNSGAVDGPQPADPGPEQAGGDLMNRREALALLAGAPLAAIARWPLTRVGLASEWAQASLVRRGAGEPYAPRFFTVHEYETVNVLMDLIIPRAGLAGSCTDASVT